MNDIFSTGFSWGEWEFIPYPVLSPAWSEQMRLGRNHPDVRKASVNCEEISREQHQTFVGRLSDRSDLFYYMVRHNPSGRNVGTVNLKFVAPGVADRGIWLFPEFRGEGLAADLLRAFYEFLGANGVVKILTTVRKENVASLRLESRLGATKTGCDAEFVHYELPLS